MISITQLSKDYDGVPAIVDLNLQFRPGEVVGFLGPNGAGKSTTMKILTGFILPSSGKVDIFGHCVTEQGAKTRKIIGYLPEGAPIFGEMTVWEFLDFIADVRQLTGSVKKQRMARVIEQVELASVLDKRIDSLSKGFKRRVGLAQAIIHDPKVLILDEPTDGLDPNQKHQVRNLIRHLSHDKIVIISTHILEEVSAVCNRAVIINQGQILFNGTPEEIISLAPRHNAIRIDFNEAPPTEQQLALLEKLGKIEREGLSVFILASNGDDKLSAVLSAVNEHQWQVGGIYRVSGQMDQVFRQLTAQSLPEMVTGQSQ